MIQYNTMMLKYAVVRINGKQYRVSEGQEVLVDKFVDTKSEPEVLLLVSDEKVSVGKPTLKGVKIKVKIVSEMEKGEKIDILKYKAKSRYRKRIGFRPQYTRLLIQSIS